MGESRCLDYGPYGDYKETERGFPTTKYAVIVTLK